MRQTIVRVAAFAAENFKPLDRLLLESRESPRAKGYSGEEIEAAQAIQALGGKEAVIPF